MKPTKTRTPKKAKTAMSESMFDDLLDRLQLSLTKLNEQMTEVIAENDRLRKKGEAQATLITQLLKAHGKEGLPAGLLAQAKKAAA